MEVGQVGLPFQLTVNGNPKVLDGTALRDTAAL